MDALTMAGGTLSASMARMLRAYTSWTFTRLRSESTRWSRSVYCHRSAGRSEPGSRYPAGVKRNITVMSEASAATTPAAASHADSPDSRRSELRSVMSML